MGKRRGQLSRCYGKQFLSQKLDPVSDERRDGRSSGSRVNAFSPLPKTNVSVDIASSYSLTVAGTAPECFVVNTDRVPFFSP
jgi:hypothetical protein